MFVSVTQWLTIFFVIQGAIIYQFANRDLWTSMSKRVTTSFANLQLSSSTFPPSHHQLYFSTSVCNYDGMTITASRTHDASSSRRRVGVVKAGLFMSDGFHPMGMIMGIPKLFVPYQRHWGYLIATKLFYKPYLECYGWNICLIFPSITRERFKSNDYSITG